MADTVRIDVTLVICQTRRYPYWKARMLGPRTRPKVGDLEVPVSLRVDRQLLEQRTPRVVLDVAAPPAPTATAGTAVLR